MINYYNNKIKIKITGSSHSNEMSISLNGIPSGIVFNFDFFENELARRRPTEKYESSRIEKDEYKIISGITDGKTDGDLLTISFKNKLYNKQEYDDFINHPRPGHTDFISLIKYKKTFSGSGIFSGRMTLLLVAAGTIAKMCLPYNFKSELTHITGLEDLKNMEDYLNQIKQLEDSAGARIKITVENVELGLGKPLFNKATSKIAAFLFVVPGVKGVLFGDDFITDNLLGSTYNDVYVNEFGKTKTNHSGGFNGGLTNGNTLIINVDMRPASSIRKEQTTYNFEKKSLIPLLINGRHDTFYQKRAQVVLEAIIALALLDLRLDL